ncbi:PREDICTED: juvenile hormone acid O-methyltransferase-like [Trachymyrmex cornetzi]|uniref:Putative methyltransferase 235L n=1 Tax=Trachymyrmex cornetzi TaxID=471704 RepID=A0A195E6I9_9HYME|nr:PREDICTED: juvenile hormone acid O-methyltransferase-like [Trachymyrmex cornetzi]KYN20793.1 Putative methyltransferase 235L [Trachymyrmex cornetzi]
METPEEYVDSGSNMQHRDVQDIIDEFNCELSNMRGKCLDIGSGPGNITKELLLPTLPHDAEVVGVDVSETMVNYANQKYSDEKRLSFDILDIETSELPSDQIEQYDNVVSFYCLHWCNDIWRALENIYKLLRPNGKALMMFIGYHSGFEAYLHLKQCPRYQSYLQDARRYVPYFQRRMCKDIRASLRKMLGDVGFEILHCSKREKSYHYSKQSLKNHVYAVNPFIKRIPDDMKGEFIDNLLNEIMIHNALIPLKSKNSQEYLILPYYLLIAYVQKPPSAI